ncbi:hypothetical protein [Stutzerimonas kunmingensis]|uniref:hypothetical protein n=1 Tax=Stutzerimonas kunmingensis TaxID=1211807 RepID=UPI0024203715|nr:hypothetical protein [Stutzerimonas kunmingensis]WOF79233.1 hypothetical protein P5704_001640 [Pseudomonas sp. FeN3W]
MARRSKLARKKNNITLVLIVLVGLAIAGLLAGVVYLLLNTEAPPDPVTLCPASGPTGHTVVLVDNTEPMNFIQRQALTQRFKELAEKQVLEGQMISVFVLGESFADNAMPIFEKCNPGTGEGKSKLNANPAQIKARYIKEFRSPLMQLRQQITLDKPSDRSPVFEMLQMAAINGFNRVDAQGPRTLVVFSDMLPHMPEFSMFKSLPDFKTFSAGAYGRKSQASLDGVEVHLNYLINYPNLQTTKQAAFWEQYFDNSGAELVEIDTFEG